MNIYILTFITMLAGFVVLKGMDVYQVDELDGKLRCRVKPLIAILAVLPLIYFAWNREQYFGDTNAYFRMFDQIPGDFSQIGSYLQQNPKDPGFTIFMVLFKTIGLDARGIFLIIALIQGLSLAYVYRKYSSDYFFSILLFFLSTDYYSWMQNGIRQYMAVSIIFAATPLILNKKYVPSILVILFAASFHQSALLMIPVIFLVQGEALNQKMLWTSVLTLISLVFLDTFTDVLDSTLQNTQYGNVVTDYQTGDFSDDNGTNLIRVLVYSIPFILALIGIKSIRKENNRIINICTNMSLLTCGSYLISAFTSGIFLGRLPIYFSLYSYILLPWEFGHLFVKKQKTLLEIITIMLYILFWYFQMGMVWAVV